MKAKRLIHNVPASARAFTLLELLTVIAIIGILAAITVPNIHSFKPNVVAAAIQQLQTDVARARQLAISQHTTVFMVFVPPGFWNDPAYSAMVANNPAERVKGIKLLDKQLTGYTFVTLRSVGDQPGASNPRYLAPWKTLPEGVFILTNKFDPDRTKFLNIYTTNYPSSGSATPVVFSVRSFATTNIIPFPSVDTPKYQTKRPYEFLPYIAFDYLGRLTSQQNELIPLVKGSLLYRRDPANGDAAQVQPNLQESPPGNSTNAFSLLNIDWLTGRARAEHQEIR